MACAEGEPQAVGGSVRACFAVWSVPLQSCCIEHVRVGALSVCVQSANVVGSFFRVPAASHVVSVRSKHFPDGIYNSHTNGAVGGALFQILVRSPSRISRHAVVFRGGFAQDFAGGVSRWFRRILQ